jgi:hypothetical protein
MGTKCNSNDNDYGLTKIKFSFTRRNRFLREESESCPGQNISGHDLDDAGRGGRGEGDEEQECSSILLT